MSRMNALWNCKNPYQGSFEKVLCLCSAGLLRSPTVAGVLYSRGYNTRAAGIHDYALIKADEVLVEWADIIIFVHGELSGVIEIPAGKKVIYLDIPDNFDYRDIELIQIINEQLDNLGFKDDNSAVY